MSYFSYSPFSVSMELTFPDLFPFVMIFQTTKRSLSSFTDYDFYATCLIHTFSCLTHTAILNVFIWISLTFLVQIRLNKNYRSTRYIVEAAASLIQNNAKRCQLKNVLTDNSSGSKVHTSCSVLFWKVCYALLWFSSLYTMIFAITCR